MSRIVDREKNGHRTAQRAKVCFIGAAFVGGALVIACGKDPAKSRDWGSQDGNTTARVSAQLTGNDFTGNSVLISGARDPAADGKLPCSSSVSICLNFNADGTTPVLVDLCASDMSSGPTGLWSFAYTVFDGVDCMGNPVGNLTCPNSGPEALPPGVITTNNVTCTAATAAKTWDFNVDASQVECPDGATCIPVGETFKRVFITSTTTDGNIGGPLAADAVCQARASAAGLPGTYKAWISNTETEPGGRFTQSTDPYRLLTGTLVALNWTDLTDGTLANPIDRNEFGAQVLNARAWTSTDTNGTYFGPNDCLGYTTSSASASGLTGTDTATGTAWTRDTTNTCDTLNRLYCFEQ